MMMASREALVDYTMPLGLHHLIGGDHYAPMPENKDAPRADWSAVYYHRADSVGLGFDRTHQGSGGVDQYHSPLREQLADPATCPENLLLWFHHVSWDQRLKSGRSLWEELVLHYTRGADEVLRLEASWSALLGKVDDERHRAVLAKLQQQAADAAAWRDKCLRYFQTFSKRPLPDSIGPGPAAAPLAN
jgi:alpha-glucuronidase